MGGHSAWRKRVEAGLLAKQSSGAICRHRPHFGRKGKDILKNKKGNIGGGNPKKMRKAKVTTETTERTASKELVATCVVLLVVLIGSVMRFLGERSRTNPKA